MRTVTGPRVELRPWRATDEDFLFDLESRWETVRYLGPTARPMTSRSEARASIARRRALRHPIHGIWLIVDRATQHPLGNLLLKPVRLSSGVAGPAPVEVGWHLHPDAQGAGYATEAAATILDDAATRGLKQVIAVVDPRNEASRGVCLRIGMTQGPMSEAYYDECSQVFSLDLPREPAALSGNNLWQ
ncbi:GNAT family N-acetyltransferase [Glutamicibacter sp. X7]